MVSALGLNLALPIYLPNEDCSLLHKLLMETSDAMNLRSKVLTIAGPLLIATMLNTFLYGLCFLQFVRYFTSRVRDRLSMKLLVVWELVIDTLHSTLLLYMIWQYLIDNFSNEAFLEVTPWSITSTAALTALSACPIQIYLSHRVKKLSGSWVVFTPLLILSLAEGSLGIATSTQTLQATNLIELIHTITLLDCFTAVSVATDVSISVCLIFYLRKKRTGIRQTDHLVSRLVREAVETASFASVFSIMLLVTSIAWPSTQILTVFALPLGRVYTNTFLAILNSREEKRRVLQYGRSESTTTDSKLLEGGRVTNDPQSFTVLSTETESVSIQNSRNADLESQ